MKKCRVSYLDGERRTFEGFDGSVIDGERLIFWKLDPWDESKGKIYDHIEKPIVAVINLSSVKYIAFGEPDANEAA